DAVANMMPRITQDRLGDRRSLLKAFDALDRRIDKSGVLQGMDSFDGQALDLIRGKSPIAFDINREPQRLRERYGPKLGENLLLARRLCEAGVGLAVVACGGWAT